MKNYISSLGGTEPVDFETAVLNGKAPDGGLYVPTQLPQVNQSQLDSWRALSYSELACKVLALFIDEETVPSHDLAKLVNSSFSAFSHPETIPHRSLGNGLVVQELFHGPTLSFKDVAMGFVVNLFDYFLERKGEHKTLMVATSGDTGPAAAYASIGKSSISTWVFFPEGMITQQQIRQMTTLMAPNVHPVSIAGCRNGSDDLDELITGCFQDETFREEMCLSSVNSINWARVMTQVIHYFYGYLRNTNRTGDPVHFAVPCGAFGNMCAGAIARRMGLPIDKLIVAGNANTTLGTVIETGEFNKKDILNTLASAIDIAVPMNFWRHIYFSLAGDTAQVRDAFEQYESMNTVSFSPEQHACFSKGFTQHSITDSQILSTIKTTWNDDHYLLDPHGAVAVAAAQNHLKSPSTPPIICLATAHPAKFPETTLVALGKMPQEGKHHSLEEAMQACERKYSCHYDVMGSEVRSSMRAMVQVTKDEPKK